VNRTTPIARARISDRAVILTSTKSIGISP
jgi:hypothetical protein